jgi:hypothetical protein
LREAHVTGISSVQARVEKAESLAAVLDAAYDAFQEMLSAIRSYEDSGEPFFAALVMAAAAAADGRDAVAAAPSLPRTAPGSRQTATPPGRTGVADLAAALAALNRSVSLRLLHAAASAETHADRVACRNGAACADEAHWLVAGNGP